MRAILAVKAAKKYLAELFEDESINDIVLEEVVFDKTNDIWKITLSFARPGTMSYIFPGSEQLNENRSYKVVHVSKDGEADSIFDRILRPVEY